ncbi:MAG: CpsD/CapB family tyrosine-protein kinase [Phycisphaerae bacterium]|jgi:Mrp family chromosome partitioning ATPase
MQEGEVARAALVGKAEEIFRGLWATLFYSGRPIGKSLLVCSGDSGEGASTVACGLALAGSMPSGSSRVALVDFNLRRPALHEMLGGLQGPGIGEIIAEGLPPESAAQRISTSLDLYSIGSAEQRRGEMLSGDRLAEFFTVLRDGYDHVLVDVAAVNHYPDASVLAGIVKDVVLVAHTDRTPREAVAQAKKCLESGGGRLAGLVLNLRTYPIPGFLYRRV